MPNPGIMRTRISAFGGQIEFPKIRLSAFGTNIKFNLFSWYRSFLKFNLIFIFVTVDRGKEKGVVTLIACPPHHLC